MLFKNSRYSCKAGSSTDKKANLMGGKWNNYGKGFDDSADCANACKDDNECVAVLYNVKNQACSGLVRCTETHQDISGHWQFDTWRLGSDCALAKIDERNFSNKNLVKRVTFLIDLFR